MQKIILFLKKHYLLIISSICLIVVLGIIEDIYSNEIMKTDTICYNLFVNNMRSDSMTSFMKIITNIGSASVLIGIAVLSFIILKNKKYAISITSNLMLITLLNQILKYVVQRPRPDGYRLIYESGYSFPSGHSMISMAFYGYLIYLSFKLIKSEKSKWIISILLGLLILLIGISRIYLGVHYASDVISGFLISILYLIIFIKGSNQIIKAKENK
jgi:membrane-associated phospholipid phosphatase